MITQVKKQSLFKNSQSYSFFGILITWLRVSYIKNDFKVTPHFKDFEGYVSWNVCDDYVKDRINKSKFVKDIRTKLKKKEFSERFSNNRKN